VSFNRRAVVFSFAAGLVVFCAIQDRVTAAGTQQYVEMQRMALAGAAPPVRVDDVMAPAIRSSLRQGLLWGSLAAAVGLTAALQALRLAAAVARRSARG